MTLELLYILHGGVIKLLLRSFVSPYLSEKGRNFASKEDIAHLIDEVESVITRYLAEMENRKASTVKEREIHERRRRIHEEICNSLQIFIQGRSDTAETRERFFASYARAWLWASDEVLMALNHFLELKIEFAKRAESVDMDTLQEAYARIVVLMRSDVGQSRYGS